MGSRGLSVVLLLALWSFGCATAPLRLKTDDDEVFEVQPRGVSRVELSADAYRAAMTSLYARWELPAPSTQRPAQVQRASWGFSGSPVVPGTASGDQLDLSRGYRGFCEHRGEAGDCLGLFDDGVFFTPTDKRTVATRIALSEAFVAAAGSLLGVSAHQVEVAVLAALVLYMGLLALPEPVSKVLVVAFAAHLVASIGVDLFLSFVQGYRALKTESENAETFSEVRAAGERWGKLLGPSGAKLVVVLVSLGAGSALGAVGGGSLPGAAQMAANAESQGFLLAGVGAFSSVEVAAAGSSVTFGVAAGAAVAPWVLKEKGEEVPDERPRGFHSFSAFKRARGQAGAGKEWHHIVEKTPGNVERFGAARVHHDDNLIKVDVEAHRRISALYSSSLQVGGGGLTVRQWLSTQSFAAQRAFGLKVLRDYGVIP